MVISPTEKFTDYIERLVTYYSAKKGTLRPAIDLIEQKIWAAAEYDYSSQAEQNIQLLDDLAISKFEAAEYSTVIDSAIKQIADTQ